MAWFQRLLNVIRPRRLASELDREVEFHLKATADELVARGMDPREAAQEARRRFGNRTVQQEDAHDVNVLGWLESLFADIRYAVRALVKSPSFAAVAILSLALGIGANSAIFSLTNAVILKPLPVAQPEQLLQVSMAKAEETEFTNPLWEQLRDATKEYASSLAVGEGQFNLA